MATIIRGEPDPRFAVLEQGVNRGVENFFQERERAKKEQKFLDAFRAVNAAPDYDSAVKAMGLVDREILANPQALSLLGEQIQRRFPPQEAVQIDTPEGIQTTAVRKGDVSGALSAAESRGGRLAQDTELERQREFQDEDQTLQVLDAKYKRELGEKKLSLEERRTAAAELRARAAAAKAAQGKGPSEKDKEIDRVTALLGGNRDRATKIVYGLEDTDIDPQTGEARILDKVNGRVAIVPAESLPDLDKVPGPKDGQTLWDAAIAGTGPFSALRAGAALPTAYFGVFEPKKTIEARQKLDLATQKLTRALSVNKRFPQGELENIRKNLSLSPSMWVHPETLRRRMVTVDSELRLWYEQAVRDGNDPRVPGPERAEAKASARDIQNFISELGVPEEHRNGQGDQNAGGVPDAVATKYPQVTFERWNRYTPEQRKRLLEASQEKE